MTNDAIRRLIVSRRARFIAAAVLGVTVSSCEEAEPQPCLTCAPEGCNATGAGAGGSEGGGGEGGTDQGGSDQGGGGG